jgi:DNA invertase Pin-like site-specific DNA recombinase
MPGVRQLNFALLGFSKLMIFEGNFTMLGAVAQLERSLIAERVRAGLRKGAGKGETPRAA